MKLFFFVVMTVIMLTSLLGCAAVSESANAQIVPIQSSVTNLKEAEDFALRFSHLEADDVEFARKEMKGQGGDNICELEYVSNSCKYKCYINADTGLVMKYDFDGSLSETGSDMGNQEIVNELKLLAPDIKEDTVDMDVDKSNDDGLKVYEGVASSDTYQYEFEIQATSGTLVEWKSTEIQSN